MSNPTYIAIFRSIVTDHLPDVHQLEERLQVFWVLAAAKAEPSVESLTSAQVASILQEVCGIGITRQRVTAILKKSKGFVATSKKSGKKNFKLMKRGEDDLLGSSLHSIYLDPEKPLTSRRRVEELFEKLDGEVRICDPYLSSGTLDYLAQSARAANVRLLTENVQDSSRLKRDLAAFRKEHPTPLEVRVSQAGQLHDRYIIYKDGMFWVGSSLKDLGKRQSVVVRLSSTFATEMSRAFEREWNRASKFA
jgi:hypothetical protein